MPTINNISDTLNNFTETYQQSSSSTPDSQVYELTPEQVKKRKVVKAFFWSTIVLIVVVVIVYKAKKNKK